MSDLTFDNKFARSRDVEMDDFSRESSVLCCCNISLCRARFVDFRAEVVGSESSSRESCDMRADRLSKISSNSASVFVSSALGFGGMFDIAPYCEYVWNSDSVCVSSVLVCCRSCAQLPVEADMCEHNSC